jgi:acid phosphatase family membrane protein YuiD
LKGGYNVIIEHFLALIKNGALIVPTVAWLIAQLLKATIDAAVNKTFRLSRLFGDGGMPSGHSATVMSLATIVGLTDGFDSITFAIAMVFAIVVMHDAIGVRREAGKQARMILSMVEVLGDYLAETDKKIKDEKLKVLVGHTPLQVICGALLGFVIAVLYFYLLA